ncbi:adenylosuccinate lyase [Candidatus Geothermarchaeota archaeon ex4572_27]|nr:MAG: adenylosuccinate lyase [Candidatus Geothermarchaeota archaeon ex4572_27]
MVVHPVEYRYGSDEVRRIFSREEWLRRFIEVELAILRALEEEGMVPRGVHERVREAAREVSPEDVERIEGVVRHESMAVVLALSERAGEAGSYIHLGATSNDVLDSVMATQIRDAGRVILSRLDELIRALIELAWRERRTPCIGRTHGRAALPTTFGYRMLMFVDELDRAREALARAFEEASVGKYSGAVGTYAELGPRMGRVERRVMEILGVRPARYSTQVVPRDRLARLMLSLALLSGVLDQLGREVRNLQRSGIEEVFEPFGARQVGSSAMPHKRNPIMSEKICGLAKVVRGLALGALENIVLEHERDLTNSSFERVALPEIMLLVDEQLRTWIYSDLIVQVATLKGADRQKAHERLRQIIMGGSRDVADVLRDEYLGRYVSEEDLRRVTDLGYYVEAAEARVREVLPEIAERYGLSLAD